jgi:diguanylate cyclase (GGDEF)-like protein
MADDETLVAMSDIGVQIGQWLDREAIRARLRAEEEARRAAEERARRALEFRAFHDMLTGLPNRHLFADRLGHRLALARREQKPLAVMILDVDRFKSVNDRFGHFAGDLVLEEVAQRLRQALRGSDTAARIGGDEFAILPGGDVDRGAVEQIAGKIRDAFAPAWVVEGNEIELGVSIGSAFFPEDASEPGELMRAADAAMYAAKRAGAAAPSDLPH